MFKFLKEKIEFIDNWYWPPPIVEVEGIPKDEI